MPFAIHADGGDVAASKPGGVSQLLERIFHWGKC
jgi:hypothetical protein